MTVRLRFTKLGKIRWTSHRDVARIWERALRRAGLPVAYSEGFSPRPKLSFGLALPTGCESLAEYLDVELAADVDPEVVGQKVEPMLPAGISVLAAAKPAAGSGSLQEDVSSCAWEMCVPGASPEQLDAALSKVMAASSLPIARERKGRTVRDDLRPSLLSLRAAERDGDEVNEVQQMNGAQPMRGSKLVAELATRPRGVRPAELAQVIGMELGLSKRTFQWIERDGSKFEPLDAHAAVAAPVGERVP